VGAVSRPPRFLPAVYPDVGPAKADLTHPAVLMATVTNVYDGLICSRVTSETTLLACGFQVRRRLLGRGTERGTGRG
jgi:hypothetical protein